MGLSWERTADTDAVSTSNAKGQVCEELTRTGP
jgi:hypothetical protein